MSYLVGAEVVANAAVEGLFVVVHRPDVGLLLGQE